MIKIFKSDINGVKVVNEITKDSWIDLVNPVKEEI